MIKHTLVGSTLVILLVGSLMYCISPDEMRFVYAKAMNWVSAEATALLPAPH